MNHQLDLIRRWIRDAGQTVGRHNPKQAGLYLALCYEEMGEAMEAAGYTELGVEIQEQSKWMRSVPLTSPDHAALLDAAMDLIWVAAGLACSLGADPVAALDEVIRSNDSKRLDDGSLALDDTGKVIKGPRFSRPELGRFLPPTEGR